MSMQDSLLILSDGQTINTDEYADQTDSLNLEEGSVADQQVGPAWLCARVVSVSGLSGIANGLSIFLMTRDDTSFSGGPTNDPATENAIACISNIPLASLQVVGAVFCAGFLFDDCKKHLQGYYSDEGGTISGTLLFDLWIQNQPVTKLKTQKIPV